MAELARSSWGGVVALVIGAAAVARGTPARADAAPPPDYKDQCVALGVDPDAPGCERCVNPEFKDRACHARAAADGLVERCRGWSYVVYCKAGSPVPKAEPAPRAEPAPEPVPVTTPPATSAPTTEPTKAPAPAPAAAPVETAPKSKGCAGGGGELAGALVALFGWRVGRARR